jgi:hypothetical protein
MTMRMIASPFSRRSCGRVPLTVIVAAAVIGCPGSLRVGRPGSTEAGGGVGEPLSPMDVMKGSAITARPSAPAMTKSVMNVEKAVAIVPPILRDFSLDLLDAEAT